MKRFWNIPDFPVYSLVTKQGDAFNMNICTYVMSVSMHPKQFAVAIYHPSQTYRNILQSEEAVLQLLHPTQAKLVKLLGKTSGKSAPKCLHGSLRKLLVTWQEFPVLEHASGYVLLSKKNMIPGNDHDLFLFDAIKTKALHEEYLSTRILGEQKIIRI